MCGNQKCHKHQWHLSCVAKNKIDGVGWGQIQNKWFHFGDLHIAKCEDFVFMAGEMNEGRMPALWWLLLCPQCSHKHYHGCVLEKVSGQAHSDLVSWLKQTSSHSGLTQPPLGLARKCSSLASSCHRHKVSDQSNLKKESKVNSGSVWGCGPSWGWIRGGGGWWGGKLHCICNLEAEGNVR